MEKQIAIIGLGYVGLPLALTYALEGFTVSGVDIDPGRIAAIRSCSLGMREDFDGVPVNAVLKRCLGDGTLSVSDAFELVPKDVHTFIVTVGIPISRGWELDLAMLRNACTQLGRLLREGDLVICRSTVPVGTTRGLVRETLERESGLAAGDGFDLAYSSERIAEGSAYDEFRKMPLVVGGITEHSRNRAVEVLGAVNREPVFEASSMELVEAAKMFENAQRDVNVAVANQLARFAHRFGIPTRELVRACNTHTRVKILNPGIGVGGHCIPYASPYLFGSLPDAGEYQDLLPTFVSARQANAGQPAYIAQRISERLEGLEHRRLLVVGAGMKDFSDDITGSPALDLAGELTVRGAEVRVFDTVAALPGDVCAVENLESGVLWADGVILPILQGGIDYAGLKHVLLERGRNDPVILFDFRGVYEQQVDMVNASWYVRL
ncbi:MAG: nucleotide sugar dehydrogenase [Caldisericota bacterium]|nr:nucleotide sugar dehydrogenase [Caldisericota bacterium]